MRTFETAHRAAQAIARDRGAINRVECWLSYADRLIADGTIRGIRKENGQISHWVMLDGREWWVVRTPGYSLGPAIISGPHRTKREGMQSAGYSTSTKKIGTTGHYVLASHSDHDLIVVQTQKLKEFGVEP